MIWIMVLSQISCRTFEVDNNRKMKKLLSLILFSLISLTVFAGGENNNAKSTTVLAGKVVDHRTGEALVGAEVVIAGTTIKAMTDFDGNFKFSNVKPGTYQVNVNFISYESESEKIMVSTGQAPTSSVFKMMEIE